MVNCLQLENETFQIQNPLYYMYHFTTSLNFGGAKLCPQRVGGKKNQLEHYCKWLEMFHYEFSFISKIR